MQKSLLRDYIFFISLFYFIIILFSVTCISMKFFIQLLEIQLWTKQARKSLVYNMGRVKLTLHVAAEFIKNNLSEITTKLHNVKNNKIIIYIPTKNICS